MNYSGKDGGLQKKLAASVLAGLERVRPHLARMTVFKTPQDFYHRQFGKGPQGGIVVFADGIEFVVRPDLIASSVVSKESVLRVSPLRETQEVKRRLEEAGSNRASFSHEILLAQSGQLLESYVQYVNLGLRDESSGLTTINATHFEVKALDTETFDWAQPIHFGPNPPTVAAEVLRNLEKASMSIP